MEPAKVRDHLLSSEYPLGRYKASSFTALGYRRDDRQRLDGAFRHLVASEEVVPGQASRLGDKCEVRGTIQAPSGRRAEIVTVWIILAGERAPRFVTAYPGAKR